MVSAESKLLISRRCCFSSITQEIMYLSEEQNLNHLVTNNEIYLYECDIICFLVC